MQWAATLGATRLRSIPLRHLIDTRTVIPGYSVPDYSEPRGIPNTLHDFTEIWWSATLYNESLLITYTEQIFQKFVLTFTYPYNE